MSGFYGVLGESDSSGSDEESSNSNVLNSERKNSQIEEPTSTAYVDIPSFEDLSTLRGDEETVLRAVYGDDFSVAVKGGVNGYASLQVVVRPLEIEKNRVGSSLLLNVRLSHQYPYVVPKIDIREVKGLSDSEKSELMRQLKRRANQLSSTGNVMMLELVQVAEKFLHEHNRDPTLSAWEQMHQREKAQKELDLRAQEELSQLMNKSTVYQPRSPSESVTERTIYDYEGGELVKGSAINPDDLERELTRQKLALEETRRHRGRELGFRRFSSYATTADDKHATKIEEEVEDSSSSDVDDDYEVAFGAGGTSASRYRTDFVELGVLGRGGGGEVVKVRNRLDRRIYAIKKIILELEQGRYAKFGKLHNRKLRREVTTISRMTHKNIVRYYQAWVEGEGHQSNDEDSVLESEIREPGTLNNSVLEMIHDDDEEDDDDDDDGSAQGWWANSPPTARRSQSRSSSWSHSSSSDEEGQSEAAADNNATLHKTQIGSDDTTLDVLGLGSPLLNGFGFQNQAYQSIVDNSKQRILKENDAENEDIWDESSSVHAGNACKGRNILYIQMQYCETTLRRLIDDGKVAEMKENEIWRLVRQILEALAYIHDQNIVSDLYACLFLGFTI